MTQAPATIAKRTAIIDLKTATARKLQSKLDRSKARFLDKLAQAESEYVEAVRRALDESLRLSTPAHAEPASEASTGEGA